MGSIFLVTSIINFSMSLFWVLKSLAKYIPNYRPLVPFKGIVIRKHENILIVRKSNNYKESTTEKKLMADRTKSNIERSTKLLSQNWKGDNCCTYMFKE